MQYLCLRDCYVNDRFWQKGEAYELPDEMEKSEKNFKLVEPQPITEPVTTETPEKPRELKPGQYFCSKCQAIHRETSNLGKRHLKYKLEV